MSFSYLNILIAFIYIHLLYGNDLTLTSAPRNTPVPPVALQQSQNTVFIHIYRSATKNMQKATAL